MTRTARTISGLLLAALTTAHVIPLREVRVEASAGPCTDAPLAPRVEAHRDDEGMRIDLVARAADVPRVAATLSRGVLRVWLHDDPDACTRHVVLRPELHAERVSAVVVDTREGRIAETRVSR